MFKSGFHKPRARAVEIKISVSVCAVRLSGSYKLSPFVGKVIQEGVEHKTRPLSHIVNTCVQYPDGSYSPAHTESMHFWYTELRLTRS